MMIPELGEQYQIVVDRKAALDTILVRVEIKKQAFSDRFGPDGHQREGDPSVT